MSAMSILWGSLHCRNVPKRGLHWLDIGLRGELGSGAVICVSYGVVLFLGMIDCVLMLTL